MIFYLKEELGQTDATVGIVFGIASIGTMLSGLFTPRRRRSRGFGFCLIGGFVLAGIALILLGFSASTLLLAGIVGRWQLESITAPELEIDRGMTLRPTPFSMRVTMREENSQLAVGSFQCSGRAVCHAT